MAQGGARRFSWRLRLALVCSCMLGAWPREQERRGRSAQSNPYAKGAAWVGASLGAWVGARRSLALFGWAQERFRESSRRLVGARGKGEAL